MLGAVQVPVHNLWKVIQTAVVTNERVGGIVSVNPVRWEEHYTNVLFTLLVFNRKDIDLTAVRIYGIVAENLGEFPGPAGFPAAGSAAEALCEWTTNPVAGEGQSRVPTLPTVAGVARFPLTIVPHRLLIEYSTANVLASPNVTFGIDWTALGPPVIGTW